jgi:uncharacterized membrane protein
VNEALANAVVLSLLCVIVVAGAVMLIANRRPGNERVIRVAFLIIVLVVLVFVGIEAGLFSSLR